MQVGDTDFGGGRDLHVGGRFSMAESLFDRPPIDYYTIDLGEQRETDLAYEVHTYSL